MTLVYTGFPALRCIVIWARFDVLLLGKKPLHGKVKDWEHEGNSTGIYTFFSLFFFIYIYLFFFLGVESSNVVNARIMSKSMHKND